MTVAGGGRDVRGVEAMTRRVCLGIVAASDLRRHLLKKLAIEAGCDARTIAPQQLAQQLAEGTLLPDAWLLDTAPLEAAETVVDPARDRDRDRDRDHDSGPDADDGGGSLLEQIVQASDAPLLVSDEAPPAQQEQLAVWRRRLLGKLAELMAAANAEPAAAGAALPQAVWVLAASTGGPAAVGEFLAALRPGLPIALVYAQHIEAHFDRVLGAALAQHGHYAVAIGRGEQRLHSGSLLIVPADRQLRFLPFHRVLETDQPWSGPYQPVCDQVIAQLARQYRDRCGVIVFSGLCDDGALGCRIAQSQGSAVWVQSPASCACPEMPAAALATGAVDFHGTPAELAQALNNRYSRH